MILVSVEEVPYKESSSLNVSLKILVSVEEVPYKESSS